MSTSRPTRPAPGIAFTASTAFAAFASAVAAMVAVIAIGDRYIHERSRACDWPRPATVPRLPWYELPLGITATVLMALSAGLAVLAYRRLGTASRWQWSVGLLAALAVLGALFAAWFGIHAVLADSGTPLHCGG